MVQSNALKLFIMWKLFSERRSRPILGALCLSVVVILFPNHFSFHYGWCDAEAVFGFGKHKKLSNRCEFLWGVVKKSLMTFVNKHLNKLNLEVTDLDSQFSDGVFLCLLVGLLEGYFVPLHEFHLTPQVLGQFIMVSAGIGFTL